MTLWGKMAIYCERVYGVQYDREEQFFCCPECGEPIYKDDWRDSDYILGEDNEGYCPICEEMIYES